MSFEDRFSKRNKTLLLASVDVTDVIIIWDVVDGQQLFSCRPVKREHSHIRSLVWHSHDPSCLMVLADHYLCAINVVSKRKILERSFAVCACLLPVCSRVLVSPLHMGA